MGIVHHMTDLLSHGCRIESTALHQIFTRYGLYRAKMFQYGSHELLAVASLDFFERDDPLLYVHTGMHQCNPFDEGCACALQPDIVLNTIAKSGGMLIYVGQNPREIDDFLRGINARKLSSHSAAKTRTNFGAYLKGFRGWNLALNYMLKDFGLSAVQLITDHPSVPYIVEHSGVTITRQMPAIAYAYGDTAPSTDPALIAAAKAISFEYKEL